MKRENKKHFSYMLVLYNWKKELPIVKRFKNATAALTYIVMNTDETVDHVVITGELGKAPSFTSYECRLADLYEDAGIYPECMDCFKTLVKGLRDENK